MGFSYKISPKPREILYLSLLISSFLPGLPSPEFPESRTFLQTALAVHTQLNPISPRAQNSCASRGIQSSPGPAHNGVPPSTGSHCAALALCLAPGLRQGSRAWGRGSVQAGRPPLPPPQEEGLGPGRKDGRQLGGQKLSPSHRGTLAGGWGQGGLQGASLPCESQPAG